MKFILQSLVLVSSFCLVFMWERTNLSNYSIQALSILIIAYILLTAIRHRKNPQANFGGMTDIFILNTAIFLLIFLTNDIISPLFFLLYFLGFGITFIFEPVTVFVYTLGAIAIFLPVVLKNGAMDSYLKLGSLLLITPLAFFFGQTYKDRDKELTQMEALEERSKNAADTIAQEVKEIIVTEKKNLQGKNLEKLNEILEETEDLREETKESL
ncbi:MAG TPA: hypothetical protein VGT05_04415 [Patescibacteria group bacterium]|nr:hypothetical protein [Patescibacteria group bacterium]